MIQINGSYRNIQDIENELTPIINNRIAKNETVAQKELSKSYEEYINLYKNIDESDNAMMVYYSLFIPSPEECKTKPINILSQIFRAIVDLIKKILKYTKDSLYDIWQIISNPDEYYVKLRGNLVNFFRVNPQYAWSRYLLILPDLFRLFIRLMIDDRVSSGAKKNMFWAIVYLIIPLDFIPESVVGIPGYIDDTYMMILAITNMLNTNYINREILYEHWLGTKEELNKIINLSMKIQENIDFFRFIGEWFKKRTKEKAF